MKKIIKLYFYLVVLTLLSACGLGVDVSHPSQTGLQQAPQLAIEKSGEAEILLTWQPTDHVEAYRVYWSADPQLAPENTVSQTVDEGRFSISKLESGSTIYVAISSIARGREGPRSEIYTFTLSQNVAPKFSNNTNIEIPENKLSILSLVASDPDSSTLTFKLVNGDDSEHFLIDEFTGELRFKKAPDFENPNDEDGDNQYQIKVLLSDGVAEVEQLIIVIVADIDEPQIIATYPVAEQANVAVTLPGVEITFSHDMAVASINKETIKVMAAGGVPVDGSVTYDASARTATFTPLVNWLGNSEYQLVVTRGVVNSDGMSVGAQFESVFFTQKPSLQVSSVEIPESAEGASVEFFLDFASGKDASFELLTQDVSAISGSDYTALSDRITFSAGETAKTVVFDIINDDVFEFSEKFNVKLSVQEGLLIPTAQIDIVIQNDDQTLSPVLEVANGDKQAILYWPNVAGADSYNIYYSTGRGVTPVNYSASGGILLQERRSGEAITGLENGIDYFLVVTAVTGDIESEPSNEVAVRPRTSTLHTPPMTDTGITFGANYPETNNEDCSGVIVAEQDCSMGRDMTSNDDADGHAGFSYTKLDALGQELTQDAEEWHCVKDNITNLIWEKKEPISSNSLRSATWYYTFFKTDGRNDSGPTGTENGGVCLDEINCDSEKFVKEVNRVGLCGFNDWRLPNRMELLSLVNYNVSYPSIDTKYFPNTTNTWYIASNQGANDPIRENAPNVYTAWYVLFLDGRSVFLSTIYQSSIRLVRGGVQ